MKVIYDNELKGYIIAFEDIDSLPIVLNTNDIVKARDYFVENMILRFNNTIQEQLKATDAVKQYEDWCFDCDHCNGGVCTCNSICVDGEMWTPNDFEDLFS